MQKLSARVISFFLILTFSQKMGLELWLHNWLHESTIVALVGATPKANSSLYHQTAKCHCIDDALNPLIEADIVHYDAHPRLSTPLFAVDYSSWISAEKTFSSLRGPPCDNPFL